MYRDTHIETCIIICVLICVYANVYACVFVCTIVLRSLFIIIIIATRITVQGVRSNKRRELGQESTEIT